MSIPRLFALAALLSCLPLSAQEVRASLSGTVSDPQGSLIPGVEVEARNIDTNRVEKTRTNESGYYVLPVLSIGRYELTATTSGFKKAVRPEIELRVGDRVQLDFKLEIGQMAESITVTGEAELLNTVSASRGQVVNSAQINDLPVMGRNPFMLGALSSGVQYINPLASRSFRPFDGGAHILSINGGRPATSEILLDGAPNTSTEATAAADVSFVPSADATQEFKIQTNTYDAQYGRTGGGVVSVSLKSGTNDLHGSLYHYLRNDKLNANNFEANRVNAKRSAFRWNQPGLEVDGPVVIPKLYDGRNKTFFMFSWEKIISSIPFPATSSVPSPLQRSGNFSETFQSNGAPITVYDPLTTREVSPGVYTRDPFPNNIIPRDRMDPVALKILDYLPLPNTAGNLQGFNNLVASPNPRTDEYDQFSTRGDHSLTDAHKLSARFVRGNRHEINSFNGYPEPASNQYAHRRANVGANFDVTSVLSPTTILTTRIGYMRHIFDIRLFAEGFDPSSLGFPSSLVSQLPRLFFPRIEMTDFTQFGAGRNIGSEFTRSDQWSFNETANKTMGPHSLKFGGEYRLIRNNQDRPTSTFGVFAFNKGFTQANPLRADAASGNAFASFLLGTPASGRVIYNAPPAYSNNYYVLFLQDDWRVSRNFSLNLGLRWDYESPITERYNRQNAGFDATAASPLQVPGMNLKGGLLFTSEESRLPFKRDLNNFQPRVGFSWHLMPKAVFRGGYGISYLPTFATGYNQGFSIDTPYIASLNDGITPGPNRLSNPYPTLLQPRGSSLGLSTLLGQNITFANPERTTPYVQQWSAGFEFELPWRSVFEASYVGTRSYQLETNQNINAVSAANLAQFGTQLSSTVTNPLAGFLPGSDINGATVARQQLLRPFPQFQQVNQNRNPVGRLWYDALQLRLEKRLSAGLHFLMSYTFSNNLEATGYLNDQDPIDAPARVVTDNDAPHRLVFSGGWQLPFFSTSKGITGALLGGWQMNAIVLFQSGLPVGIGTGYYSTGIDPALPKDQRSYNRWFNTCTVNANGVRQNCASTSEPAAFIQQQPFTLRTLSTRLNSVRTERPATADVSLFKTFQIVERVRLQFRAEAFNLTNTPWFGAPATGLGSTNAGVVTLAQQNDPRNVQLALRLTF